MAKNKLNKNKENDIEKYKKQLYVGSKKHVILIVAIIVGVVGTGGGVGGYYIYKALTTQHAHKCTIKFVTNGVSHLDDKLVEKGQTLEKPIFPSEGETNLTLDGWYLDKDFKLKCEFPLTVNGDMTLYAKWVVKYTYVLYDGTLEKETIYEIGDTTKRPEDPSRPGYTFAGWYEDNENEYEFGYPATKNTTLRAKWANPQTDKVVTFSYGLDKFTHTIVSNGSKVTKPIDPTYEGYTFGGWYSDAKRETPYEFDKAVTENITLYAKWYVSGKVTVTFSYGDGKSFYFTCVNIASKVKQPENPTCTGFIFDGWYTDIERTIKFDFNTKLDSDIVLFAKWVELESFVTEKEYKESFEYLININDTKDLNYQETGTITKKTNGNLDFSIKDLQVEKNNSKDIEYFYYDKDAEYIYAQKSDYPTNGSITPFYIYASKSNENEARYKYFKTQGIREQLAEVFESLYTAYQYYTFKNNKFTYHSTGEYQIDTELSFITDKDDSKKLDTMKISYIHTTTSKTTEVNMDVKFAYENISIDMPKGEDLDTNKQNRINILTFDSDRYVTSKITSDYAAGDHILKIDNQLDLNFTKLRYYGDMAGRLYYNLPTTITIYKNNKLLTLNIDYTIEYDSDCKADVVVFKTSIQKNDVIEVLINDMETHADDSYYYELVK